MISRTLCTGLNARTSLTEGVVGAVLLGDVCGVGHLPPALPLQRPILLGPAAPAVTSRAPVAALTTLGPHGARPLAALATLASWQHLGNWSETCHNAGGLKSINI